MQPGRCLLRLLVETFVQVGAVQIQFSIHFLSYKVDSCELPAKDILPTNPLYGISLGAEGGVHKETFWRLTMVPKSL